MNPSNPSNICFKKVPVAGRKDYEIPEEVKHILDCANKLSPENFGILLFELVKTDKLGREQTTKVKNLLIQEEKRTKRLNVDLLRKQDNGSGESSTIHPRPLAGILRLPAPATQVPLIVRTDLAAATDVLALDTEKIIDINHKPMSGDVCVVDLKGRIVLWAYIRREESTVCRYNTAQTGLSPKKLEMGVSLEMAQSALKLVLSGKLLVGLKIKDDLISLGFPKKDCLPGTTICEMQSFFRDEKRDPIRLSQLAFHFVGHNPQEKSHSSLRDARVTAICYKRKLAFEAAGFNLFKCSEFDRFRKEQKKLPKPVLKWEPCSCGLTRTTGKHKSAKPKKKISAELLSSFDDTDLSDYDGFF